MDLHEVGKRAKSVATILNRMTMSDRVMALESAATSLEEGIPAILIENEKDMIAARNNGMSQGLLDRLLLNEDRIRVMAEGIRLVAKLEDPVGEVVSMKPRPNGLLIGEKRVPLGVVGVIYEARPNVTADVFALCFKTGNAVVLKGGSDALYSNIAIVHWIKKGLYNAKSETDAIQLIEDTTRENTIAFMKLNQYIDILIPRGGAGLIKAVVENSTIPVIETGTGNCHIYVDDSADMQMALDIIENAKTQRIGVCNACESLVIHEKIATSILPEIDRVLSKYSVEIRGCERACEIMPTFVEANEEDWGREYLDYKISLKIVDDLSEGIAHINRYNTKHSEAIITSSYENANRFLEEIDAAAVYVNASTRFTDGAEFGFGAEVGISTQKLHARGPMGLKALTTTKYIIYGSGQIRS